MSLSISVYVLCLQKEQKLIEREGEGKECAQEKKKKKKKIGVFSTSTEINKKDTQKLVVITLAVFGIYGIISINKICVFCCSSAD